MKTEVYNEAEPYLTLQEASVIMKLSVQSVRKKCKSGQLPYYKPDRKILIPKKEVIF